MIDLASFRESKGSSMAVKTTKFVLAILLCQVFLCSSPAYSDQSAASQITSEKDNRLMTNIQTTEIEETKLAELRLPEITESMLRYSRIRYGLFFFSVFYSLSILFLIMQLKIASRLRDYSILVNRNRLAQVAVFSILLTLTVALLTLPLSLGSGYYLEHLFNLSQQSLTDFLLEKAKGIAVSALINCIVLIIFFGIVRRFRVHWPFVLWLTLIPVIAFAIFAEPIVIDPLFNKFTPMPEGSLKSRITALSIKANIPDAVILVVDKSKQTRKMNAYVTGIGGSSRIVLWDSTINGLPEDQVLSVVGHEIGHYVLNHIYWGFAMSVLAALLIVPFGYFGTNWFISVLPKRWGVGGLTDYAITPVLMMLSLSIGFIGMPLFNFVSRYQEHQADKYGLMLTENRLAMANLFVSFAEKNLSEPDPPVLIKFFLFTHPTLKERIEFAVGRKVF